MWMHARRYVEAIEKLEHHMERLTELLELERTRYQALLDEVLRMKREGYTAEPAPPEPVDVPAFPPNVWQAVRTRAGHNEALQRELLDWSAHEMAQGRDAEDVASDVLEGADIAEILE